MFPLRARALPAQPNPRGRFGRGAMPLPSVLAGEGFLLPELPGPADGARDRGLGPLRLLGIEIDDGAAEGHGLGLQARIHLGVDGAEYTLGQAAPTATAPWPRMRTTG